MDFKDLELIEATSLYSDLCETNPNFIKKCESVLFEKSKAKIIESVLYDLYTVPLELMGSFKDCWKLSEEIHSGQYIIIFSIECIISFLKRSYGYINNAEAKKQIKKFILLKKTYLKSCIIDNKFEKIVNTNKVLNWANDNEKLNLTDFALFDCLSSKTQILYVLKTLENMVISGEDINNPINYPTGVLYFPVSKFQATYPMVEKSDNGAYDYFYKYVDPDDECHIIKIIVASGYPALSNQEIDPNTGTLIIKDKKTKEIMDSFKNKMPNRDDGEINTLIYNLNTYEFNELGHIDFYINDIIEKLNKNHSSYSSEGYEHLAKVRLRKKVVEAINKITDIKVVDLHEGENGEITVSEELKSSFLFTEANWLDKKAGLVRVSLSQRAKNAFARKLHLQVLNKDYFSVSDASKSIIFYLQEERINARNSDYNATITIPLIKGKLRYTGSDARLKEYLKEVFLELRMKEIIIKDFEVKTSAVVIKFIPLTEEEKKIYIVNTPEKKVQETKAQETETSETTKAPE